MAPRTLTGLIVLLAFVFAPLSARSITTRPVFVKNRATEASLVARLRLNQDDSASNNSCWDSLFKLQSCTGEVILFFLNGETQLGPDCCKAVGLIEEMCWPNLISSLGFTDEEEEVLRGYCDKENAGH
ncbi:unnamed protein product [Rhodiola kirilowii]